MLAFLLSSAWVFGQPQQKAGLVRFEHFSIQDGLSQLNVECITQDAKGFLWVGTQDGLNRYDGYQFKHHFSDRSEPYSLKNDHITSLYVNKQGVLWVGTAGGLQYYEALTERFLDFRNEPNAPELLKTSPITAIYQDRNDMLWFGSTQGLVRYHAEDHTFKIYQHDPMTHYSLSVFI